MRKYKPNLIPLKIRLALLLVVIVLLAYVCAELAIGYTFVPGKHGGFMLSGIPTLMVAFGTLALSFAALLTIIDHYDKRPNEHQYRLFKNHCYTTSMYLIFGAPFVEIVESLLLFTGVDIFPHFTGFFNDTTWYSPSYLQSFAYIQPLLNSSIIIGAISFGLIIITIIIGKFITSIPKRWVALLFAIAMIGISYLLLISTANHFLLGKAEAHRITYSAITEPAKFNAIVLAEVVLSLAIMSASIVMIVGVLMNKIKINNE